MIKHIIITLAALMVLFIILVLCFLLHKEHIPFEKIGSYESETVYRLADGEYFDPQGWIWYVLNPKSKLDLEAISYYTGIKTIDMEKRVIIVYGYELADLSIDYWHSTKEGLPERLYTGMVELSTDCSPKSINLYTIDRQDITQCDSERVYRRLEKIRK